jgi:hypothetical protein
MGKFICIDESSDQPMYLMKGETTFIHTISQADAWVFDTQENAEDVASIMNSWFATNYTVQTIEDETNLRKYIVGTGELYISGDFANSSFGYTLDPLKAMKFKHLEAIILARIYTRLASVRFKSYKVNL